MNIVDLPISEIIPYEKNPRRNENAVAKVAESIKRYGFRQPIVVDENNVILVGHTRLEAAKSLGMETVPVHVVTGFTEKQKKAYRIADNKTSEFAVWDKRKLRSEVRDIIAGDEEWFTGFDDAELEKITADIGIEQIFEKDTEEFDMSMVVFPVEVSLNEKDYTQLKQAMKAANIKKEIDFVRYAIKMILGNT